LIVISYSILYPCLRHGGCKATITVDIDGRVSDGHVAASFLLRARRYAFGRRLRSAHLANAFVTIFDRVKYVFGIDRRNDESLSAHPAVQTAVSHDPPTRPTRGRHATPPRSSDRRRRARFPVGAICNVAWHCLDCCCCYCYCYVLRLRWQRLLTPVHYSSSARNN